MTSITRRLVLTGALAALVSGIGAGSALAGQDDALTCTTGEGQTLSCVGSVMGATVAGQGRYELRGDYSDDQCLTGNGMGGFRATVPVVTVLGERMLTIDADYAYVRTGAVRIASGHADAIITRYATIPFGGATRSEEDESRRFAFSSIGASSGELDSAGCPLLTPASWVEQIGLGAAAPRVEANGPATAQGLRRGACANRQVGTSKADRLTGTTAGDSLSGEAGADSLSGLRGHDCLKGGSGRDALNGSGGHDALSGGAAADRLTGGAGSDALSGGAGVDRFYGGAGRDVIDSRDGRAEIVSCGAGKDSVRADSSDRLSGCEARSVAG